MTPHRLTILHVNNLYAPRQVGGAEKSVQLLAESLVAAGHAVHVLTLIEQGPTQIRTLNGVQIHECVIRNQYWPFGSSGKSTIQRLRWHWGDLDNTSYDGAVHELFDQLRPDVVHTHNLAGFSTRIWTLARQHGIRVVHTLRDYYLSCSSSTRYRRDRNCGKTCLSCLPFETVRKARTRDVDAVIGISQFILDDHLRRGFFPEAALRGVIFNTVEKVEFDRAADKAERISALGFLGAVAPSKGIETLLAAFNAVAPRDSMLLVGGAGDPTYLQRLQQRYRHPGIRFLGFVDPAEIYAKAQVIVVPSLWNEPFSRVAMEAALHGIPLIASTRGGLAEVAAQVSAAITFDPDQPQALAGILRCLLVDGDRSVMHPQRIQSTTPSAFDSGQRAEDYVCVYRGTLA